MILSIGELILSMSLITLIILMLFHLGALLSLAIWSIYTALCMVKEGIKVQKKSGPFVK